ncbi:Bifunctional purine biosynthesis protein PurH [Coemansia helicoidea]|nr:Bifunctional purine biosynthesis protein PurH [Coemansia helicoidea]
MTGAIGCTRYADMYGRRAVLLYSNIFVLCSTALYAAAVNIPMLAVARYLAGVSSGCALGTFSAYVAEITTQRARCTLGSMLQANISNGIALALLLSLGLTKPPLWRVLFSMTGAIAIANVALLTMCVESPKWLVSKNRLPEARVALQRLRGSADCTEEFDTLVDNVRAEMGQDAYTATIIDLLRGRTPDNLRHQLVVALVCIVFQQVSGMSGVLFFSTTLFKSITAPVVGYSAAPTMAQILTSVLAVVGVAATFAGMFAAGRFGRRTLMLFAHAVLALCSLLIFVGSMWNINGLAIAMVFLFYSAFLTGPGPLPWVIPIEMTPIYAVSAIVAVMGGVGYTLIFAVGMVFPSLHAALGGYTFLIFAALNLLAVAVFALVVPETKDRGTTAMIQVHCVGVHNVMRQQYQLDKLADKGEEAA